MTKEMKRPISNITQDSIKPLLSNAVEFYTNKNREAHKCIQERDEYINYLESKLSSADQQQAMPVVPECVGIAIESLPDDYSAFEAISLINAKIHALPEENKDWMPVYNWLREDVKNQDIFALAFITGKYEVEKPQLFYLKNKLTGDCLAICLARASSGLYVEVTEKCLTRKEQTSYKLYFTQQEIDSMHAESYEQIEVTE